VPCDLFPPIHGGSARAKSTIKYLSKNIKLNVLLNHGYSLSGKIDIHNSNINIRYCKKTILDTYGYKSVLLNPYYLKESYNFMKNTNSDVIHCELLWSMFSGIFLKKMFHKPLIFVDHNVEYLKFKELGFFYYSILLKKIEKYFCKKANKIVVSSELDKKNINKLYKISNDKIHVIRNCTDTEIYKYNKKGRNNIRKKYGINCDEIVITFFGKLDYIPNYVAVNNISKKIYQYIIDEYPKLKFLIIGANYKPLLKYKKKNMIFTGYVYNLSNYLSASDIVIVPIDFGSGTRIKILDAASCSRPIVSTKKGVEGLDFINQQDIIITEKVDSKFNENILKLIEDENYRKVLGKNARKNVEIKYSWSKEINKFKDIYEEIL